MEQTSSSAMRQYDRPAGLSPLRRDASPQFIEGLRNDTYVSPTFKSSVFTAHEDRRATQERLRSANRDHFGNEIYRKTVYADRPLEQIERSRSRNFTRQVPSTNELQQLQEQRAPTQRDAPAEDDRVSRKSQTPTRTAHQAAPAQDQANYTLAPAQPAPQEPAEDNQRSRGQAIEETERNLHRVQHYDPTYNYTSNRARRESAERGTFYDGYNSKRAEVPVSELPQQQYEVPVDNRADIFEQESEMKRDYRRKLDEYHRYLAEANFQSRSKSQVKRLEAEVARQKAALIEEEKRLEKLRNQESRRKYKDSLDQQQDVQYRTQQQEKEIEISAERNFRTNPIHSSRGTAKKERPIMQRLGNDLQEAMQFRKKLDALTKSQRAGDLIQHTEQLEQIERGLKERTELRKKPFQTVQSAEEQKRQLEETTAVKAQNFQQERSVDKQLVRNLQEHDENNMAFERERKRAMQKELRETLITQMNSKEDKAVTQTHQSRNPDQRIVDDGFGTNDNSKLRNYDQRPQIALHNEYQTTSAGKDRQNDRQLVQALSEFDTLKVREEKERKREMAQQLNYILKEQMKLNEQP